MRHDFVKHKETGEIMSVLTRARASALLDVPEEKLTSTKTAWFTRSTDGTVGIIPKNDAVPCYADGRVKVPHLPELPDHELQLQDH